MGPTRSFRSGKRQTRLGFSPLTSSSPDKTKYSEAVQNRLATVRYEDRTSPGLGQSLREGRQTLRSGLPTPQRSSQPVTNPPHEPSSPLIDATATSTEANQVVTTNPGDDDDDDDDLILPSAKRRRVSEGTTTVRRSSRLQTSSPAHASRHAEAASPSKTTDLTLLGSPETTGDEVEVLISRPTQRKKPPTTAETYSTEHFGRSISRRDDFVADDDEIEYQTSSDETAAGRKSQNSISPSLRRRKSYKRSKEEQEELEADLEDLQDSDQDDGVQTGRTRGGPVRSRHDAAKEHFDALKRRRAGEEIPREQDSDADDSAEAGESVDFIGRPSRTIISDEESERSSVDTGHEAEDLMEEEDTFIEDDDAGHRGRPHSGIPLEFTHFASAKPAELFIHVIEWLVKNKLAPAFARNDDLYRLAMNKIDDQVKAQAGSRLISSAWNATFKYTILARPDINIQLIEDGGLDEDVDGEWFRACDACNKRNRPARYDFVLTGAAYSKNTLEPVNDSDDEENKDDDDRSRDDAGHVLATQQQHFYLGTHCAANAQMGHKLTHWKYHLNESVLQYLEEQGALAAEAVVARDKLNNKKREKQAEDVVDGMEATGKIRELWKDFENDLDDARLGMDGYEKRGGRSKGRIGVVRSSGADGILREWNNDKYKQIVIVSDSE